MKFVQVWEIQGPLVHTDEIRACMGVLGSLGSAGGEHAGEL